MGGWCGIRDITCMGELCGIRAFIGDKGNKYVTWYHYKMASHRLRPNFHL